MDVDEGYVEGFVNIVEGIKGDGDKGTRGLYRPAAGHDVIVIGDWPIRGNDDGGSRGLWTNLVTSNTAKKNKEIKNTKL